MWADTPALSFLRTPEETRAMLEAAGFSVRVWEDNSAAAIAEAEAERARAVAAGGGRPVLGSTSWWVKASARKCATRSAVWWRGARG